MPKAHSAEDTGPFSAGEKVMVPHTDKFYEAKVLRAEFRIKEQQWYYLIHYTGWNKKWDEWVEQTGLKKHDEVDAKAQAQVLNRKPPPSDASFSAVAPKKRRIDDPGLTTNNPPVTYAPITIHLELEIPAILKKQIVDDYEIVTQQNKLVPLPRQPNVADLLKLYVEQVKDQRGGADLEEEVAQGLRKYFDKAFARCLLYKQERDQANKIVSSGQPPSLIYGAEHFLRLFVKLPDLLPQSEATDDQLVLLRVHLNDVLAYLKANQSHLFLPAGSYVSAPR